MESDMVKLGKEMHLALNKLVRKQVRSPEVVGLLIEDHQAVIYKMDLRYDGQYRMIEINRFHFARDLTDDVFLMPAIIEKLNHVSKIIKCTVNRIYNQNNEDDRYLVDCTAHIREACKSPVLVNQDNIV